MANKRYDQFPAGTYSTSKIFLQANAATGALEKVFLPSNPSVTPASPLLVQGTNITYQNTGLFIIDSGVEVGSFQSVQSGFNTFIFFSANKKYLWGTGWVDNGLGRAGGTFQIVNDDFNFYRYSGAMVGSNLFRIKGDGTARLGEMSAAGQATLDIRGVGSFQIGWGVVGYDTTYNYKMGRSASTGYSHVVGEETNRGFQFVDMPVLIGAVVNTINSASAILQANSTTKGFLPPRMTTAQKNAIASPASGLTVYDTTTNKLCCYNGSGWQDLF